MHLCTYQFLLKVQLRKDAQMTSIISFIVSLSYTTDRFHVAMCLFHNRSQKRSKWGNNLCALLCSYQIIFHVICDLLLNRCTMATWNLIYILCNYCKKCLLTFSTLTDLIAWRPMNTKLKKHDMLQHHYSIVYHT